MGSSFAKVNLAHAFGHVNLKKRSLVELCIKNLPEIECPDTIIVDSTGYWYSTGKIIVPEFCRSEDSAGRTILFIGDDVLIKRYRDLDTLVHYKKDNFRSGHHTILYDDSLPDYTNRVQAYINSLITSPS